MLRFLFFLFCLASTQASAQASTQGTQDWVKVAKYAGIFKKRWLMSPKLTEILTQEHSRPNVTQICDRVYVGGSNSVLDGYSLVVDVRNMEPLGTDHIRIQVNDNGLDRIYTHLAQTVRKMEETEGDMLIFSDFGKTRSMTVAIAYLIKHYRLNLASSIAWVKSRQPQACPRGVFLVDLVKWEEEWLGHSSLVQESQWSSVHAALQKAATAKETEVDTLSQQLQILYAQKAELPRLLKEKLALEEDLSDWMGLSATSPRIARLTTKINEATTRIAEARAGVQMYNELEQQREQLLPELTLMQSWLCLSSPEFRPGGFLPSTISLSLPP